LVRRQALELSEAGAPVEEIKAAAQLCMEQHGKIRSSEPSEASLQSPGEVAAGVFKSLEILLALLVEKDGDPRDIAQRACSLLQLAEQHHTLSPRGLVVASETAKKLLQTKAFKPAKVGAPAAPMFGGHLWPVMHALHQTVPDHSSITHEPVLCCVLCRLQEVVVASLQALESASAQLASHRALLFRVSLLFLLSSCHRYLGETDKALGCLQALEVRQPASQSTRRWRACVCVCIHGSLAPWHLLTYLPAPRWPPCISTHPSIRSCGR
jgi:hypothetical protein